MTDGMYRYNCGLFFLLCLGSMPLKQARANPAACGLLPPGSFVMLIFKAAKPYKEFLVRASCKGESLRLVSDVQDDSSVTSIPGAENQFLVALDGGAVASLRFEAKADKDGGSLFLKGNGTVDVRLEPLVTNPDNAARGVNAVEWVAPFKDLRGLAISKWGKRIAGRYGDHRSSEVKGHLHSGVDLSGGSGELVYPAAYGTVEYVSHDFVEGAVVLKHELANGELVYSQYSHIKEPRVRAGQKVEKEKALGRIFLESEFKKSGFPYNHLHFEVRRNYRDKGKASTNSMSRKALDQHFIEPLKFLEQHGEK